MYLFFITVIHFLAVFNFELEYVSFFFITVSCHISVNILYR